MLVLAGAMVTSSLTGCGLKDSATVATVAGDEIPAGLANFYARMTQAQYESMYSSYLGDNMWTTEASEGKTYEKLVKDEVLKDLENMYLLEDHMDDYKISLSDDEKKAIKDAAKEFSKDNDKDDKEKVSGDTEYVERYLTSLPVVNQDLDLIISQLQSTEYGVPVQIYFFSRNKIWKEYERIQSDIFDHFFAMIPKFELKVYQYSD